MVQLTYSKRPFSSIHVFEHKGTHRVVEVETPDDWRCEYFVKSIATLATGLDHTKLRESIEVVDKDGLRIYYVEKV